MCRQPKKNDNHCSEKSILVTFDIFRTRLHLHSWTSRGFYKSACLGSRLKLKECKYCLSSCYNLLNPLPRSNKKALFVVFICWSRIAHRRRPQRWLCEEFERCLHSTGQSSGALAMLEGFRKHENRVNVFMMLIFFALNSSFPFLF